MSASLATLNGQIATACRVSLPAYGLWFAEVECGVVDVLKGTATLVLDDMTFAGTIVSGGVVETRTRYRIVGGAGGWGKRVPAKSYANDLGVKLSTVFTDAARACGETMGAIPAATIGPSFVRAEEPASRVLHELAPQSWYVDEAGVTQVGRRSAVAYTGNATRIRTNAARGTIDLAPASLAGLVPGAIVDGVEAVDVEHVLSAGDGSLRTTIWGKGVADTSRMSEALRRIVETFTADTRFCAPWEYRVVQQHGDRLDLQVVRASSGMPDLPAVPMVPSLLGERVTWEPGSVCVVEFLNGDRTRGRVTHGDYTSAPILSKLAGGGPAAARVGDTVKAWLVLGGSASPMPGSTIATVKTEALATALIAGLNLASPGSASATPVESTSWIDRGSDLVEIG